MSEKRSDTIGGLILAGIHVCWSEFYIIHHGLKVVRWSSWYRPCRSIVQSQNIQSFFYCPTHLYLELPNTWDQTRSYHPVSIPGLAANPDGRSLVLPVKGLTLYYSCSEGD